LTSLEFIAALSGNISWPFVALVVLLVMYRPLIRIINNIRSIKHGDTEVTLGEMSLSAWHRAKNPKNDPPVDSATNKKRDATKIEPILESGENATGSYKLYRNGVIIQKLSATIPAGHGEKSLTLPMFMVNEITNIQFIGDIDARVMEMNQRGFSFLFTPSAHERKIKMIISGV
jgi:hypothetical protein